VIACLRTKRGSEKTSEDPNIFSWEGLGWHLVVGFDRCCMSVRTYSVNLQMNFRSGFDHESVNVGLRCCRLEGLEAEVCRCHLLPMNRNQRSSAPMITGGRRKSFPQLD